MRTFHLLFSHQLTSEQEDEVYLTLHCKRILPLPESLQTYWSQVPAAGELSIGIIKKFIDYLAMNSVEDDYVLIQGDYGMVFALVDWCLHYGRIPVYATTERHAVEKQKTG